MIPFDELLPVVAAACEEETDRRRQEQALTGLPEHSNDLGDWCPFSGGAPAADGDCPQGCSAVRGDNEGGRCNG